MARRKSLAASNTTEQAMEILCAKHFHQCFWIPASEASGNVRLRVTYATSSNFDDESLPVALFFHPMFGGRWTLIALDKLARENGVRIVAPDRPGMGGSTNVPLANRMDTWLRIVPALMRHLHVDHFHCFAHSAGTAYLLNTLYDQRGGLLNSKPTYVALMAPWVHNEHSEAALMTWASKLPCGMLDSWSGLMKFINNQVAPSISWSGGAIFSVSSIFQPTSTQDQSDASDSAMAKLLGTTNEIAKGAEKLQGKYYFAEDTTAANEDAKLCLKMGGQQLWGTCEDYPEFFRLLVEKEKERKQANPNNPGLTFRTFYAGSDIMIGKGGQKYFEDCWSQEGMPGPIDYKSIELSERNHETVMIHGDGSALPSIFADIARLSQ